MTPTLYSYDFTADVQPAELDSFYWLDGQRLSWAFCRALPADLADLLDVVMAVYAADRRSRRDFRGAAAGQRSISVRVGVRNPGLWATTKVAHQLEELLHWLTEDEWVFEFATRHAVRLLRSPIAFSSSCRLTPLSQSPCSAVVSTP